MKVYFIPGLGAKCRCFKFIELPKGFEKVYIEWHLPEKNDSLRAYVQKMAENIDQSEPFILVGYSFGGVIVQEMNKFMKPEKTILIASMKDSIQIPGLFKILKKMKFATWFPMKFFTGKKMLSYAFMRSVYFSIKHPKNQKKSLIKLDEFMVDLNSDYFKWSIEQIINWLPDKECDKIFQIHGTKDIIFPFKKIHNSYLRTKNQGLEIVEKGSHLLVLELPKKVNKALEKILLDK
jgi:alpha-beta hydrolase superfamily lysophospholipase